MAKKAVKSRSASKKAKPAHIGFWRWFTRWILRGAALGIGILILAVLLYAIINPTITPYMMSEKRRLGSVDHEWVNAYDVAPVMLRSVVAAEDANFCGHWGFDMAAIRAALDEGGTRGASTISQQVVKNVYLWQGRTWSRKALEALITPVVEIIWSKRRIVEVYLNVAEFSEGVFGIAAASRHYFDADPADLTPTQAARLAAVLPSPKTRSASNPTASLRKRAAAIQDGAATIDADGRAACFQG